MGSGIGEISDSACIGDSVVLDVPHTWATDKGGLMAKQVEMAEQLEREERKITPLVWRFGRRQRQMIEGMRPTEVRVALTTYALKKWPDRAKLVA